MNTVVDGLQGQVPRRRFEDLGLMLRRSKVLVFGRVRVRQQTKDGVLESELLVGLTTGRERTLQRLPDLLSVGVTLHPEALLVVVADSVAAGANT